MITKEKILDKTHYGIKIYAFILSQFYPNTTVLSLHGRECSVTCNPYNQDKETLIVSIVNNCATHKDIESLDFVGDVFDFAQLYFKAKSQKELLYEIDIVLHLRLNTETAKKIIYIEQEDDTWYVKCSFFKAPVMNVIPSKELKLSEIHNLITSNTYEAVTTQLRAITDPKEKRKYKAKHFDYVTFSGTFNKRNDDDLIKHSLLMTIDLDHLENLEKIREMLLKDEYFDTELLFKSPSGDGLKWIIKIDLEQATHQEYYIAVSNYLEQQYNIKVDASGKDISRACFLCYDPEAYINSRHYLK
jgi:hypothetical protein